MVDYMGVMLSDTLADSPVHTSHCVPVSVDWVNTIASSKLHRWIHVELYTDTKLKVLHVTAFPHVERKLPIFGLDVIVTRHDNNVRALFYDETPTDDRESGLVKYDFGDVLQINLPEWTSIFSRDFIAVRPSAEQLDAFLVHASTRFVENIEMDDADIYDKVGTQLSTDIQTKYCEHQRLNKHTMAALVKKIGKSNAVDFMEYVLFPSPTKLNN